MNFHKDKSFTWSLNWPLCNQARFPVVRLGCLWLSYWPTNYLVEIFKQPRLMLEQKAALWKLSAGPCCQGKHPHNPMNIRGQAGACLEPSPYIAISLVWESILQTTERERWTPTQSQSPPPTICAAWEMFWGNEAMMVQNVLEWTANVCLNSRPTPWEGGHAYTTWMARNWKLDRPVTWDISKHDCS